MGERDQDLERWFIRRGVPHFIDDYQPTTDIWTRTIPVLGVAYLLGGLNALDLRQWTWQKNVTIGLLVVLTLVAGWMLINRIRGHRAWSLPDVVGTPELAVFLIGPTLPTLVLGQWADAFQSLLSGAGVLVLVYVLTSYAVFALLGWALRRSARQLAALASLVVRALPLLLLFTTFLFINAEVWQVAGTLHGIAYVAVLGIFFVLGAVFVLSRIPGVMRGLATFPDWPTVHEAASGTPAERLQLPADGVPPPYPLGARQQINAALVAVFSQALQITFVALLLTGFFILFGFLAIPVDTAVAWTGLGDDVRVLFDLRLDGSTLVITEPLLRVSGFLGAFTGLYFTVLLSTDATYRDEFADDVQPQIRQALAVRVAYLWHRSH
ncbi:MAG: hypothetical protein F2534_06685 [Actinobacteria bacterium]|uniref:Unannotated protein n=1 Tax=freshwater metagenome TaxID=449393 RepID=A0A6J6CV71_9ZZZZ|nr:hypothetical protein [Actinomycetota bacterium]